MARAIYAGPFIDDLAALPDQVFDTMRAKCASIADFPGVGSSLIEPSLVRAYGDCCLKLAVGGYDVLYQRLDDQAAVVFLGIVPQRKVR